MRRADRRTNALPDQPTDGHSQLYRCFVAPKKDIQTGRLTGRPTALVDHVNCRIVQHVTEIADGEPILSPQTK